MVDKRTKYAIMTPAAFKKAQARAGLTNQQVADYLGMCKRAVVHYRAGTRAIRKPVKEMMERL